MSQSFGEEHKKHGDVLPKMKNTFFMFFQKKGKKINLTNFFSFFKKQLG